MSTAKILTPVVVDGSEPQKMLRSVSGRQRAMSNASQGTLKKQEVNLDEFEVIIEDVATTSSPTITEVKQPAVVAAPVSALQKPLAPSISAPEAPVAVTSAVTAVTQPMKREHRRQTYPNGWCCVRLRVMCS